MQRSPLTLIVPSHLVVAFEEDGDAQLAINGTFYSHTRLLSCAEMETDQLSLIRVRGRRRSPPLRPIRIPQCAVYLKPGQTIELGGSELSDVSVRKGSVVEVRERGQGTTLITDIEVQPGDSGSAVIRNRQLVAVCQGMLPNRGKGVAIAIPLTTESLRYLWRMQRLPRQTFLRRGLPTIIAIGVALVLGVLGALHEDSRPSLEPGPPTVLSDSSNVNDPIIPDSRSSPQDGSSKLALPLWPRLFDPGINQRSEESAPGAASIEVRNIDGKSVPTLVWETDPRNTVDVSYDLDQPLGSDVVGLAVTLSSSREIDVRVQAAWEAECCDNPFQWLESVVVLRVATNPRRFELPYSTFTIDPVKNSPGPHEDPNWEQLVSMTFWPEAVEGELLFHQLELVEQMPEDQREEPANAPESAFLVDMASELEYQPIDGFSTGTIQINWWYIPRWEEGEISFVDCQPSRSESGDVSIRYRYPDMSSSRTLVLQMHDTHHPVNFDGFDGLEITARADEATECLIDVSFLDPALPGPLGDPPETPGSNSARLAHPLTFDREARTYRIPFSALAVNPDIQEQYPEAHGVFHPQTLNEVCFRIQDDRGDFEVLSVRIYRVHEPSDF